MRIQDKWSSLKAITIGVPQGYILGPLVFTLYINDLLSVCDTDVKIQMYADNTYIIEYTHIIHMEKIISLLH